MIYSMTGYGKGNAVLNGKEITVEIKSVNNRYFECSFRMSKSLSFLENKIRKQINESVNRGKLDVCISLINLEQTDIEVQIDIGLAKNYFDALSCISKNLGIDYPKDVNSIARFDGVLIQNKKQQDINQISNDVSMVVKQAVQELLSMRKVEGEILKQDIENRLKKIETMLLEIEAIAPLRIEKYQQRLYTKLKSVLQDTQIDQQRILTEAAIFVDKVAVDEETIRLKSHINQFRQILIQEGNQGKKLDFLTQELNRETNTIGSKSNDVEITKIVVEMKAEIEKIREQVQNIE